MSLNEILSDRSIQALQAAFPGQRIYVPTGDRWSVMQIRLRLLLGDEQANLLIAEFGGTDLEIPAIVENRSRNTPLLERAIVLLAVGMTEREIAELLGLTERWVRHCKKSLPPS